MAHPILKTCTVTDAVNSIHMHTVGLVVLGSNQLGRFPVDSADIWKHHNLGNLVVGAEINKLLNKLSQILLCTIWTDKGLFDCRV